MLNLPLTSASHSETAVLPNIGPQPVWSVDIVPEPAMLSASCLLINCSVPSSGVAFFSETRIASMSQRIGHTRLQTLMETLRIGIGLHLKTNASMPVVTDRSDFIPQIATDTAKAYIHGPPLDPKLFRDFTEAANLIASVL